MNKKARWVVVLVAVAGALTVFLAGWSVRDAAVSGHGDWNATIATLAGWAGDSGKIALGALIGAIGAWIVASQNRADAKAARDEARQDARQTALLEERRAAIIATLTEGEKATTRVAELAERAYDPNGQMPEADKEGGFHRAWLELMLMAPDIVQGPGVAYREEVANHMMAYTDWAYERRADAGSGHDVATRPKSLDEADTRLDVARATFLLAAVKHLGVYDQAAIDPDAVMAILTTTPPSP